MTFILPWWTDCQPDNKSKPSHQNVGAGDSGMRLAQARSVFCLRNKNGAISKSAESFANKIYFYCLCQNSNHYLDNLWVTISVNRLEIGLLNTEQAGKTWNLKISSILDMTLIPAELMSAALHVWIMIYVDIFFTSDKYITSILILSSASTYHQPVGINNMSLCKI